MKVFTTIFFSFCFAYCAAAQAPLTPADSEKAVVDATRPPTLVKSTDDHSLVTVLGYHDFTSTGEATAMKLPTDAFRKQLQALKDLKLKILTLEEFLAWKTGNLKLPERSVLITIDDGWKTVYDHAYPILKEFEFPFTLFIYKNYVDGGGKALTTAMVEEMKANGASVGSHSVSHPYPSTIRKKIQLGPEKYADFINIELGDSKQFLEEKFGEAITTYAYPGGFHTPEMFDVAKKEGYECLFTVHPGKVSKKSPNMTLPRYIILGTHDSVFENATRFPATATSTASLGAFIQNIPHPVTPAAGSTIGNRLPIISADLSGIEQLDPTSLVMRVAGFGKVPATFDPESKKFSWKVNRRLRKPTCDITVSWKLLEAEKYEKPMSWTFIVNRREAYLPTTSPSLPAAQQ
ncbi:MAG: polysaccharide deacetylase family protein [Rubritalea sp.]|uniref:polysaccharide deacetylase family protein n=1 Tax=Rubritalea sp. TaxID=2109375 RepID=UPI0032421E03